MKVLVGGWHPGSVTMTTSVVKELRARGTPTVVAAYGLGYKFFRKYGIEPDLIVKSADPATARQLVGDVRPTTVLTGTSSMPDPKNPHAIENELTLAARQQTGQSILTVGILGFWENYLSKFAELDLTKTPPGIVKRFKYMRDVVCVVDDRAFQEMVELGFDPGKLKVTGNPYYAMAAQKRRTYKDGGPPRVLFASDPVQEYFGTEFGFNEKTILRHTFKALAEIARERKQQYVLKIRKHPLEKEDTVLPDDPMMKVIRDDSGNPHDAILDCMFTVGMVSNMLVEARLLGRCAISAQVNRRKGAAEQLPTNQKGITSIALTFGELKDQIKAALDGALKQKEMPVQPDAVNRIIEELK